jgi:hypothetical protein
MPTDTTTMTGAEFRREVAADPEQWAGAFLAAAAKAEGLHTEADRLAFVTDWFRDAMDAAVAHAQDRLWGAGFNVPRQSSERCPSTD